jgi:hypothetical protein
MAAGLSEHVWSLAEIVEITGDTMKNYVGMGVAIGFVLGGAFGVALHNILLWACIGAGVGIAYDRRNRISN